MDVENNTDIADLFLNENREHYIKEFAEYIGSIEQISQIIDYLYDKSRLDTHARFEKYSSNLDISRSLIRTFVPKQNNDHGKNE